MSVPRTGTGAHARAGTAGIHSSYGRQVGVVKDGQLQGQPALYAAGDRERKVSQGADGTHRAAGVFPGCFEGAPCACRCDRQG